VRIEDVDRAREIPGAADDILRTLECYGLDWDGPVLRQSDHADHYAAALGQLAAAGHLYPCSCSRTELEGGTDGVARYPGYCRAGPRRPGTALATRLRVEGLPPVTVTDRLHGTRTEDVAATVGDCVLRRRDGYWSYLLAVVVDDAAQGVTDVVRGFDLWAMTPLQRLLQGLLGLATPRYLHLPLLLDAREAKLAKSHGALPAERAAAPRLLTEILGHLRHPPPQTLTAAPVREQLAWAVRQWNPDVLRGVTSITSKS
jgi:glutamyl-Q tRNA(Asp) synthetase